MGFISVSWSLIASEVTLVKLGRKSYVDVLRLASTSNWRISINTLLLNASRVNMQVFVDLGTTPRLIMRRLNDP